jgi:predicted Zn-dependent peptidase
MTSKLFVNVREKLSLCYDIGSSLYGAKGIVTVSAGIDFDRKDQTCREIARQLQAICDGDVTEEEFLSAREALLSSLQAVHDSPGAIEGFYATAALNGQIRSAAERMEAIRAVTKEQVAEAARSLSLHTTYFLKGASE